MLEMIGEVWRPKYALPDFLFADGMKIDNKDWSYRPMLSATLHALECEMQEMRKYAIQTGEVVSW